MTEDKNADSGDAVSQVYHWKDLEEDIDPEALRKVVQAIESRDRVSHIAQTAHIHNSSDGFVHLLLSDKDIAWDVWVKVRTNSQCILFCSLSYT